MSKIGSVKRRVWAAIDRGRHPLKLSHPQNPAGLFVAWPGYHNGDVKPPPVGGNPHKASRR